MTYLWRIILEIDDVENTLFCQTYRPLMMLGILLCTWNIDLNKDPKRSSWMRRGSNTVLKFHINNLANCIALYSFILFQEWELYYIKITKSQITLYPIKSISLVEVLWRVTGFSLCILQTSGLILYHNEDYTLAWLALCTH